MKNPADAMAALGVLEFEIIDRALYHHGMVYNIKAFDERYHVVRRMHGWVIHQKVGTEWVLKLDSTR